MQDINLQEVQATVQGATWTISSGRLRGVRSVSGGQGCSIEFKACLYRRITILPHGVPEQGCVMHLKELYAFLRYISGVLLGPW